MERKYVLTSDEYDELSGKAEILDALTKGKIAFVPIFQDHWLPDSRDWDYRCDEMAIFAPDELSDRIKPIERYYNERYRQLIEQKEENKVVKEEAKKRIEEDIREDYWLIKKPY